VALSSTSPTNSLALTHVELLGGASTYSRSVSGGIRRVRCPGLEAQVEDFTKYPLFAGSR